MASFLKEIEERNAEFVKILPWIDPTLGYPDMTYRPEVTKVENRLHVAVHTGGAHKSMVMMPVYGDCKLDEVDDKKWDLFSVECEGTIEGRKYYWGMFVLGIGAFHVMIPADWTRELLPHERKFWANRRLGMFSGGSEEPSYLMTSGVIPA